MEPIRFRGQVRYWDPAKSSGLSVVEIPTEHIGTLGGLKQQRVHGRIDGVEFTSNVMPAGGGRLALSLSKAIQFAAGIGIGDAAKIEIDRVGRE
jgi:hypothetical protein